MNIPFAIFLNRLDVLTKTQKSNSNIEKKEVEIHIQHLVVEKHTNLG